MEAPEIASGTVEIKAIAREAGGRTKIAVYANDSHIDPVGSLVGQRGVRVSTVLLVTRPRFPSITRRLRRSCTARALADVAKAETTRISETT